MLEAFEIFQKRIKEFINPHTNCAIAHSVRNEHNGAIGVGVKEDEDRQLTLF